MLGAVRVGLVAVMMVLILTGPSAWAASRFPARLAAAADAVEGRQMGLKSLPPETAAFIDQLKKNRWL